MRSSPSTHCVQAATPSCCNHSTYNMHRTELLREFHALCNVAPVVAVTVRTPRNPRQSVVIIVRSESCGCLFQRSYLCSLYELHATDVKLSFSLDEHDVTDFNGAAVFTVGTPRQRYVRLLLPLYEPYATGTSSCRYHCTSYAAGTSSCRYHCTNCMELVRVTVVTTVRTVWNWYV